MRALEVYAVFTPERAQEVQAKATLEPRMFGCNFLPLKESPKAAMEAALQSSAVPLNAVQENSEWILLRISLSADRVLAAFEEEVITNYSKRYGTYRWYGSLSLESDAQAIEWHRLELAPLGLEQWSQVLSKRYREGRSHCCAECGSGDRKLWTATRMEGGKDYCSKCWHNFFTKAQDEAQQPWDQVLQEWERDWCGDGCSTKRK